MHVEGYPRAKSDHTLHVAEYMQQGSYPMRGPQGAPGHRCPRLPMAARVFPEAIHVKLAHLRPEPLPNHAPVFRLDHAECNPITGCDWRRPQAKTLDFCDLVE